MNRSHFISVAVCLVLAAFGFSLWMHAETRGGIPAPKDDAALAQNSGKGRRYSLADASWGTQSVFERGQGGSGDHGRVCRQLGGYGNVRPGHNRKHTGHAESVKVVYDPSKITYGKLLQIFFSVVHDPTQLNRQGPDVGTSYRSAIFYTNEEQRKISSEYIAQLNAAGVFKKPIVTEVTPLKGFYDAESYHQDYALHHPDNPYILVCDRPKVEALKKEFPDLFQDYKGE